MENSTIDAMAFYAAHGLMTDPREQADLLADLLRDLPGLCRVVRKVAVFHRPKTYHKDMKRRSQNLRGRL